MIADTDEDICIRGARVDHPVIHRPGASADRIAARCSQALCGIECFWASVNWAVPLNNVKFER